MKIKENTIYIIVKEMMKDASEAQQKISLPKAMMQDLVQWIRLSKPNAGKPTATEIAAHVLEKSVSTIKNTCTATGTSSPSTFDIDKLQQLVIASRLEIVDPVTACPTPTFDDIRQIAEKDFYTRDDMIKIAALYGKTNLSLAMPFTSFHARNIVAPDGFYTKQSKYFNGVEATDYTRERLAKLIEQGTLDGVRS